MECAAMIFEWDENKALANIKKHGVSLRKHEPFSMMTMPFYSTTPTIPKPKTDF